MSSSHSSEYLFQSPRKGNSRRSSQEYSGSNSSSADDWMTPITRAPSRPSTYTNFHAFLLGISGTLTWNVYLSSSDFFKFVYPEPDYHPVIYFPLSYDCAWLFINLFLGPLSSLLPTKIRISVCSFLLSLLMVAFPITCYVFRGTNQGYSIFLGSVFVATILSSIAQTSGFGFAVQISQFATGLNGAGMALGGLILVSARIACQIFIPGNYLKTTFIYYGLVFFFLLYVSISQIFVERTAYVKHLLSHSKTEAAPRRTVTFMLKVLGQIFCPFFNMVLINLVTYGVFPELAESYPFQNKEDWGPWRILITVMLFNLGDTIGRFSGVRKVNDFKKRWIFVGIYARFLFAPLFVWLKYQQETLPMDLLFNCGIFLLGLTNGITTNLLLIRTPLSPNLPPSMQEPAGFLNLFAMYLGLLGGGLVSIPINAFDWRNIFKPEQA